MLYGKPGKYRMIGRILCVEDEHGVRERSQQIAGQGLGALLGSDQGATTSQWRITRA